MPANIQPFNERTTVKSDNKSNDKHQPHSDLREMLQNIPPLPFYNCPEIAADILDGSHDPLWVAHCRTAPIGRYLVHAANVLPRLLKAAEDYAFALGQLYEAGEVDGLNKMDAAIGNAFMDAIAEAHGGNVQARLMSGDLPVLARLAALLIKAAHSLRDRAGEDPGACLTAHSPEAQDIELAEEIESALFDIGRTGQVSAPIDEPSNGLKTYTVLLLYPDYIASNFGQETYMTSVEASTPADAIKEAQAKVVFDNDLKEASDFHCLMVIEGEHQDVKP